MKFGIYIPTFGRPKKLQQVANNIKEATHGDYDLYWCVESFDKESIKAAKKTGAKVIINRGKPCYADALQTVYEDTTEQIFFWGTTTSYSLKTGMLSQ